MTAQNPPKKNQAWTGYINLQSIGNPGAMVTNPTIAAGDFKLFGDGVSVGNPGTTPTVTPAAGRGVKIVLTAGEMNYDNVLIEWRDTAGTQVWADGAMLIQTTA